MSARASWGLAWFAILAGSCRGANDGSATSSDEWVLDQPCTEQRGSTIESASPGTTEAAESPAAPPATAVLPVSVDRVQAQTLTGLTIDCFSKYGLYTCEHDAGLASITVTRGEQQRTVPAATCQFPHEDGVDIAPGFEPCVKPGTPVLQGKLLGLDPEEQAHVWLITGSSKSYAQRRCTLLLDNGYRCETLGARDDRLHTLRASQTGRSAELKLLLPVNDCAAELVKVDVELFPKMRDAGAEAGP